MADRRLSSDAINTEAFAAVCSSIQQVSALASTTAVIAKDLEALKIQLENIKKQLNETPMLKNISVEEELNITRHALEEANIRAVSAEARKERLETELHEKGGSTKARKPVRIYMDGCFDMMHFGHSNALRQAKAVGDILVVGLIGDEEVMANKGAPPLMPHDERAIALRACKWVDEVIEDCPYDLTPEWCVKLFGEYQIDYVVHGDDPCYALDGSDAYAYCKSIGKFKMVKRTEGISTTDIVGRMLMHTSEHHVAHDGVTTSTSIDAGISEFLPTTRRIMQFANNKAPEPGQKIVYICGAFDLFNAGHIEALKKAREFGDFVIVGVHTDKAVNQRRGGGFPIMNLHERVLSVLSCRYADEVIIGAPWVITEDLIKSMNISVVVCGTLDESTNMRKDETYLAYDVPRKKGILKQFESPRNLSVNDIMQRIFNNRDQFEKKFEVKKKKNEEYYKEKTFVAEL